MSASPSVIAKYPQSICFSCIIARAWHLYSTFFCFWELFYFDFYNKTLERDTEWVISLNSEHAGLDPEEMNVSINSLFVASVFIA